MEHHRTRRPQSPGMPLQSPGLHRSRSRSSPATITLPDNNSCAANTSQRSHGARSKSVTRSRSKRDEENLNPFISSTQKKVLDKENKAGFAKLFQRGSNFISQGAAMKSPPASSPSAWALSPGRSLGFLTTPSPETSAATEGGRRKASRDGGVSSVLRYFRVKKGSSAIQVNELHRFRILQNRLLQWRFVNVRAQASMAILKRITEDRIFSVWLHNVRMRNRIVERRIEVEKAKNDVRLYRIILCEMSLLNEWAKLEKRNQESVAHLGSILTALSQTLPLTHGAKADVEALEEVMGKAMEIVSKIEALFSKNTLQKLEKALYMVTERVSILKEEEECLDKFHSALCFVTSLLVKESSTKVQLIQANKTN